MHDRRTLAAALVAVVTLTVSLPSDSSAFAADNASLVHGIVRFQMLSPSLVRMEYSPKASFVDAASVAVVGRSSFAGNRCDHVRKGRLADAFDREITVAYKLGSGPFTKNNLRITWNDQSGEHTWKPGDKDDRTWAACPRHDGQPQHGHGDRSRPA